MSGFRTDANGSNWRMADLHARVAIDPLHSIRGLKVRRTRRAARELMISPRSFEGRAVNLVSGGARSVRRVSTGSWDRRDRPALPRRHTDTAAAVAGDRSACSPSRSRALRYTAPEGAGRGST